MTSLTLLRLIIPIFILKQPLLGVLVSTYLDLIDWGFFITQSQDYVFYQVWDKLLDLYYLSFAAYASLSWRDKTARIISLSSFLYRAVGVLLFVVFKNYNFLLLFPNFFENFFVFYLIYTGLSKTTLLFKSYKMVPFIILALLLPKLMQEYAYHIGTIPAPSIANFVKVKYLSGETIEKTAWVIAYLTLPTLALAVSLKTNKISLKKLFFT